MIGRWKVVVWDLVFVRVVVSPSVVAVLLVMVAVVVQDQWEV